MRYILWHRIDSGSRCGSSVDHGSVNRGSVFSGRFDRGSVDHRSVVSCNVGCSGVCGESGCDSSVVIVLVLYEMGALVKMSNVLVNIPMHQMFLFHSLEARCPEHV